MVTQAPQIFKEALIDLARAGAPRPKKNARDVLERRLAQRLVDYTRRGSLYRDDVFAETLYRLRPDWIRGGDGKKGRLIELAKAGAPRPSQTARSADERALANALVQITGRTTKRHDPEFTDAIRRLRPDWFADLKDDLYVRLAERAKRGLARPKRTSRVEVERKMAHLLNHAPGRVRERDRQALLELRRLRPDWFVLPVERKRARLLELARQGALRPSLYRDKAGERRDLAVCLHNLHARRDEPDVAAFFRMLRRLAPHWFKGAPG